MSFSEFGQQFINGLSLGSIFALVSIGLAMIFGILRLINFAHGDVLMVGAFATYFYAKTGLPFLAVAVLVMLTTAVVGVVMERVAYRPLRGAPDVALLLTSLGVSIALENGATLAFSPQPRKFPTPHGWEHQIALGSGIQISVTNVITIGVSLALMALLTLFVTRTQLGISMRAAAENMTAAQLMGINIDTVIVAAFAIGSALAGIAGILWSARAERLDPLMGFIPVLVAFAATVIGGFGSIPGAVIGAYLIGFGEIFLIALVPSLSGYRDAFVFGALIIVLLVRPQGILGSTAPEKI